MVNPERPPLPRGGSATSLPPQIAADMQRRRDKLAMDILKGLMKRWKEPGYDDEHAVIEAYRLARVAMKQ